MTPTQRKNNQIDEVQRMSISTVQLALTERLRQELAKPEFLGFVNLEVAITNGVIPKFEVAVKEIQRIKPL